MATNQPTEADPSPPAAGDWKVVPERSELGFTTRALGLFPVRGRYSGFEGELHFNAAGTASGVLTVEAETVSTGIKRRDRHLRTTDFFAVEKYPQMTFELASLTPTGDGSATLTGTLQIRDRRLPIETPVTVTTASDGLRIDADFEVDHHASGFEFKHLPKTVRVKATLTFDRAG